MKTYYIHWGDKEQGPYSLDQLKEMQIKPAVLVWTKGLKTWIKAKEIPELQNTLFPIAASMPSTNSETHKDRIESAVEKAGYTLGKHWKKTLAALVILAIVFLVLRGQNNSTNNVVPQKEKTSITSSTSRQEHQSKEAKSPVGYLTEKTNWRKNLIGETVLEGTLQNTSDQINFKNAMLRVTWLSKTNIELQTNRYAVNEYMGAGKTIKFKFKVRGPSKFAEVKVKVVSVTPVE